MDWTLTVKTKTGWGETQKHLVGRMHRGIFDASEETVGLRLDEAKSILSRLQGLIIKSQIEEYVECARVCTECDTFREIRDHRTRKLQTPFGTVLSD
jgi:hypothetical protein